MRKIVLLLVLIGYCISTLPPLSIEQQEQICNEINKNRGLLFPGKCLTTKEQKNLGKNGRAFLEKYNVKSLEPVILVPGLAGSALEVEVTDAVEPHYYCYSNYGWRRLWLNIPALLPLEDDCWYHNMDINYNETTNTYYSNKGITTRPIDWGGVSGIDYLDYELGFGISLTAYYAPMIEDLKAVGYQVGLNIRGAPFDWRKPLGFDGFYDKLKLLVEETYTKNSNKKVHLITHSMGAIQVTDFLGTQPQAWKDKFIGSLITVAAPWAGSPKALRAIISGDNFGIEVSSWLPLLKALRVRPTIRKSGGIITMVPEAKFFNSTVLVKTPTKSYTGKDLSQLFTDIGSPVTNAIYKHTDGEMDAIVAPKVEMHCLYGINYPTEQSFYYKNGWDTKPEITVTPNGDGTVPEESLERCIDFRSEQSQPVEIKEFDLGEHLDVLNDEELLQYVLKIIIDHTEKN